MYIVFIADDVLYIVFIADDVYYIVSIADDELYIVCISNDVSYIVFIYDDVLYIEKGDSHEIIFLRLGKLHDCMSTWINFYNYVLYPYIV